MRRAARGHASVALERGTVTLCYAAAMWGHRTPYAKWRVTAYRSGNHVAMCDDCLRSWFKWSVKDPDLAAVPGSITRLA
jgi:hypothetical protein